MNHSMVSDPSSARLDTCRFAGRALSKKVLPHTIYRSQGREQDLPNKGIATDLYAICTVVRRPLIVITIST